MILVHQISDKGAISFQSRAPLQEYQSMAFVALKPGSSSVNSAQKSLLEDDHFNQKYLQCKVCHVAVNKLGIVVEEDITNTIKRGKMIIDYAKCPKVKSSNLHDLMHELYPQNYSLVPYI